MKKLGKKLTKNLTYDMLTETEKEVDKTLWERWKIGRQRYGEGISFKQGNNPIKWVDEAIDEVADLFQYLVALKLLLKKGVKK